MNQNSSNSYQNMDSLSISNNENESTHLLAGQNAVTSASSASPPSFWRRTLNMFSIGNRDRQIAPVHVRKVPVKVEPKVFFANERTFLAWIHMSLTMASISVGIVA